LVELLLFQYQWFPPKNFPAAADGEELVVPMGYQMYLNPESLCEHSEKDLSARVQGMAKPVALC
jgi:hypothetical protein